MHRRVPRDTLIGQECSVTDTRMPSSPCKTPFQTVSSSKATLWRSNHVHGFLNWNEKLVFRANDLFISLLRAAGHFQKGFFMLGKIRLLHGIFQLQETLGIMVIRSWMRENDSYPPKFLFHFTNTSGCHQSPFPLRVVGWNSWFPKSEAIQVPLPFERCREIPPPGQSLRKAGWPPNCIRILRPALYLISGPHNNLTCI